MRPARLALLAALAAVPALAQDYAHPWDVRIEGARDNLDNGYDDWREALAQLTWSPRRGLAVLGGARWTERYAQDDREAFGGFYAPLGGHGTTLHVEGAYSSTHKVLAHRSAIVELMQPLARGWVLTGGYKRSRYTQSDVEIVNGALEWYTGDWRFGYTGFLSRTGGSGWAPAHRLAASWYRSRLTHATLSLARGREVENVFPTGLVTTQVRAASLAGGFELTPQWGLTFELAYVEQGDLYTRRSARVGTRFLF